MYVSVYTRTDLRISVQMYYHYQLSFIHLYYRKTDENEAYHYNDSKFMINWIMQYLSRSTYEHIHIRTIVPKSKTTYSSMWMYS